ncbi:MULTISPECIES: helix-turn-helix transcriptional regulator [Enterobacteriaceae]|uniref:AraC family transcriptional regulator n=1 Tax=Kluyvera genomosp. 2 TaxID=2774054 RepID=A0A2T2XZ89_9ENTR|nr:MULTISPECIES: AraC family transcriptional regulator [Enterobacteriaceae]HAT3919737.1 helix-turn-helix transcriptional regulator [Kluyvera ascorbata]PSR45567.1 AraC family transcriptional regulator [Kluyvera genomosp. 2]BBQ84216.1 AraC family transcriptional regulator [Klebsiella sp. WP3-W18-ESBL-02]BBR21222.1 AraC family transcriptional regulator [Klebsiella sp. WP3-S18-ESBL-05]BBR58588.1 AraC family transcriptional regulator [Klebsiella sp. WP4-W18-ESBL-05]
MFPFSVTHPGPVVQTGRQTAHSGYELIAFDAEKLNVFAAEVRYCEPHWHLAPELITVLSGRFSLTVGQRNVELGQGEMLYINAEEVHALSALEDGSQLVTVQFSPGLFDELHPAPVLDWRTSRQAPTDAARQVFQRLIALLAQIIDERAPFQRIAAIYLLLDALVAGGKPTQRAESTLREEAMIKEGIDYINQHFDRPLTLSDVAHHSGMSYSWFSRLFKKVSRHNFKEYLTLVRLNKARTLLRDTRTPITEISHSCGFQEHKSLIAAFNKYCGLTPTEYRKRFISRQNLAESTLAQGEDCLCLPLNRALLDRLTLLSNRCQSAP